MFPVETHLNSLLDLVYTNNLPNSVIQMSQLYFEVPLFLGLLHLF